MKIQFAILCAGAIALSASLTPAIAMDMHAHGGAHDKHQSMDGHGQNHDHDHDHDHDHAGAALADNDPEKIRTAVADGGTLVRVSILGMVCDFCATALTKTFGKRDEVAAVHVDLDTKVLSLVLAKGQSMEDAEITRLVTGAGYKVKSIDRGGDRTEGGNAPDTP